MDLWQKYPLEMQTIEAKLRLSLEEGKPVFSKNLGAQRIQDAMSYSLFGQGKRLRPWLVLESARVAADILLEEQVQALAFSAAIAVEYVHTYSLIHDDLPAMDDDDLRRGLPTSHRQFDEATAILTGDALLSDAFAVLGNARVKAAQQCVTLAKAIGSGGMIQGQMDDVYDKNGKSEEHFLEINRYKTGKLFECACVLGALSVDASPEALKALRVFGMSFGQAFQLADDLVDESKIVLCLGRQNVSILLEREIKNATQALIPFGKKAERMLDLAKSLDDNSESKNSL
jgi:geranylgeranyl diphosphate synthase, type II